MRTARLAATTALAAAALAAWPTTAARADPAPAGAAPAGARAEAGRGVGTALELSPAVASPGDTVAVRTEGCAAGAVSAGDASAVGAGRFALAADAAGRFRVPPSAQPGTYEIVADCADGGTRAAGDLTVTLAAADEPRPKGHVATGTGGALGPDRLRTAAGLTALAAAAAGGTWLLHRRARGDHF